MLSFGSGLIIYAVALSVAAPQCRQRPSGGMFGGQHRREADVIGDSIGRQHYWLSPKMSSRHARYHHNRFFDELPVGRVDGRSFIASAKAVMGLSINRRIQHS